MADEEKPELTSATQAAGEDTGATEKVGGEDTAATVSLQGCPVKMNDDRRCGRPIYQAPTAVDKVRVCLMHSRHPEKSDEKFQEEFERILKDAPDGIADFTGFVFPSSDYGDRTFEARCIFREAMFTQAADFLGATFTQAADFLGATFTQAADFREATFEQDAVFFDATFTQGVEFSQATFTQAADFWEATFEQDAVFFDATFAQGVKFSDAMFTHAAVFGNATFTQDADFNGATFQQAADFRFALFKQGAQFRETEFREDGELEPGPVFGQAVFERPEAVIFYDTYLGQALFHNCDVSRFTFSFVHWGRRENGKWKVLEEEPGLDLWSSWTLDLRPPEKSSDERNYTLIAELYQQLKKNYDDRRDYWTAGDWHYGEMEMKRLSSPRRNRVLRWLHRNLGLVAWYKYASEYGENYTLPTVWLLVVVLAFSLLFPLVGLKAGAAKSQSTTSVAAQSRERVTLVEAYSGHNIWTAVGVACFHRDLDYQPVYPSGRALQWAELLLTSTLIALFLLALRRQFRR